MKKKKLYPSRTKSSQEKSNIRSKDINRTSMNSEPLSTKGKVGSASSLERVKQPNPLGDVDQFRMLKSLEGLAHKSDKGPLSTQFEGSVLKAKNVVSGSKGSSNLRIELRNSVHEKSRDESNCMKEREILASILNNANESEPPMTNGYSVTHEVNSEAENKTLDTLLVSHQVGKKQGESTIASFQDGLSSDVRFTNGCPNKLHGILEPNESLNPGSVSESIRIGGTDLDSNIRNLPFSVGKVAVNQVSGLKDDSVAISSSMHMDHDKQTQAVKDATVVCKNTKVNSRKDNGTVVAAHQNKYWATNEDKPDTDGESNSNVADDLIVEIEKKEAKFQSDHEASKKVEERSMVANAPQPSTLQNDALDKAIPSATKLEMSDAVQNLSNASPRKRRRLILSHDDEDEEKAEDVRQENVNHQPLKCNEPMAKHNIDTEFVDEAVQTGDLNDPNLMNGRPVKRRRRYIVENEDEEDTGGSANPEGALSNVSNWSMNDVGKMASQIITEHSLQSRPSDSEYADQQCPIFSQPLDEPIWSGVLKIDTEVFLKLDAHLSNKACQRVCELSRSLQRVVEVMMLPRSQAWPERWMSSGPTDDSIGLFLFPHNSRQNEASTRLISKIIKSDSALIVTVGIADLLIFPSVVLPEQYYFFQGKHYLWGVFRRKKDRVNNSIQVEERDDSVPATGERQDQEQGLLDQQGEALFESSDQESFVVKHVEDHLLMAGNEPKAQKDTMKVGTMEGIASPGSSWPDSPKAGSNCSVQPRTEYNLHAPGDVEQQEDFTSSPEWNASCITKQSSTSRPAQCGTKQPHPESEPSTPKLFDFVDARTPRSQQLIQEIVSEGALLLPVPEEIATTASITDSSTGLLSSALYPVANCVHPQAFDFVAMGHDEPDVDPEACLELFPVQQEHIGWAPRAEVSREVDLNLSLGRRSGAPSLSPLL
ncbi:hypothetical protein U9M48_034978 [Paspalum notatum var. saurae]|uniref:AIPP2-like SPOC-like domain-containing protein n=1 Tax=Paspalum notatum var. saurae TaxID=547442 RepID=A0AAQ3UA96_PASNO